MKYIAAAVIAAFLTFPQAANAAINVARVSPSVKTITSDRAAIIPLRWSITTSGGVSVTVETGNGERGLDGNPVTLVPALPTQTKTSVIPANNFNFTFTENLTVPVSLIKEAARTNQSITFRRAFSDDNFATNTPVTVTIDINGGIGGRIDISRIRLAFDDGSTICSAKAGEDVTVKAFLATEGSGVVRGQWQVRDSGLNGNFRTLKTVSAPVGAGKDVALESPPLPVYGAGRFDVRFKVDAPSITFTEPTVTCAVFGTENHMQTPQLWGAPVDVVSPKDFTPIGADTKIEWQARANAKAYRIEVLADKDGAPVASQEVKGGDTTGKLSPLTLQKLDPRRRYMIRVLAR